MGLVVDDFHGDVDSCKSFCGVVGTDHKHLKAISRWASLDRLGNTNSLFMFSLRCENTFLFGV